MLLVVVGHYYNGLWWVPVLFGLWVFAFSSGMFSAARFRPEMTYREYLPPKVLRLLVPLMTAQVAVVVACIWGGRADIWNFDSLFSLFGLTRVATWFGLERAGPLGNGLWFLNLVWIFYLLLPLLAKVLAHRAAVWVVCVTAFGGAITLENLCWQGVFFFSTAFAFVFGAAVGFQRRWFSTRGLALAVAIATLLAGGFRAMAGSEMMNATWLMVVSLVLYHLLLRVSFPLARFSGLLKRCDTLFLPVYVTHTYFFIWHSERNPLLRHSGFALSLILILTVSWLLARINSRIHAN